MGENPNEEAQTADFEFSALDQARNYRAALVEEFAPFLKGRVVEVGAGVGQMSSLLRRVRGVAEFVAIEPELRFCQMFRRHLPDCPLREGTIDSLQSDYEWNAVVSINVLEHIRADEDELAKYRLHLSEANGRLCLFVPARQEIYAPIDRDFGHHRRYSHLELRSKLQHAGFKVELLSYFNSIGYLLWWLNFRVFKKRSFNMRAVLLFDRLLFPVIHALERRVMRPPVGQSLIAVASASTP